MTKKYHSFQSLVYSTDPSALSQQEEVTEETPMPSLQRLSVKLDKKKRKGKIVTLISGFQGKEADLAKLARELKQKCGSGGSAKDGEVIIQGDFREKVMELLREWGYGLKAT